MNSKMTTNSQLLITKFKNKDKTKTKQTTTRGTELQKWRSHGGLSAKEWEGVTGQRGIKGEKNGTTVIA